MSTETTAPATHRITWTNPLTRRSVYDEGTKAECLQIAATLTDGRYRIEPLEDLR